MARIAMTRAHLLFKKLIVLLKGRIKNLRALWRLVLQAGWILARKAIA